MTTTLTTEQRVEREVRRDLEESLRRSGVAGVPKDDDSALIETLQVNVVSCKFEAVALATVLCGYSRTEDDRWWDLLWMDHSVSRDRLLKMMPFQRINHFPGMLEICRKLPLARLMRRMAAALPDDFAFHPNTWLLPDEGQLFLQALHRARARSMGLAAASSGDLIGGSKGQYFLARDVYLSGAPTDLAPDQRAANGPPPPMLALRPSSSRRLASPGSPPLRRLPTYILKPSSGAMGRNIHLVQLPEHIPQDAALEGAVAQQYIDRPLLLDGRKFDCRVYVLVRSVWPLELHVYQEGLARLATVPYRAPDARNIGKQTMHLTNFSINKKEAPDVTRSDDPVSGCKRLLSTVLKLVAEQHNAHCPDPSRRTSAEALWRQIEDLAVKTLLAIHPHVAHTYCCAVGCHAGGDGAGGVATGGRKSPSRSSSRRGVRSREGRGSSGAPGPSRSHPRAHDSLCFEVLGFDVLFDDTLKPWLVEINHSPSFGADTLLDRVVKLSMLSETIALLRQEASHRTSFFANQRRRRQRRLYGDGGGGGDAAANAGQSRRGMEGIERLIGDYQAGAGSPRRGTGGGAGDSGGASDAGAARDAGRAPGWSKEPSHRVRAPSPSSVFRMAATEYFSAMPPLEGDRGEGSRVGGAGEAGDRPRGGSRLLWEVERQRRAEEAVGRTKTAQAVLEAKNAGRFAFRQVYPPAKPAGERGATYDRVLAVAERLYHARQGTPAAPCHCAACTAARHNAQRRETSAGHPVTAPAEAGPVPMDAASAQPPQPLQPPQPPPQPSQQPSASLSRGPAAQARPWICMQGSGTQAALATARILSGAGLAPDALAGQSETQRSAASLPRPARAARRGPAPNPTVPARAPSFSAAAPSPRVPSADSDASGSLARGAPRPRRTSSQASLAAAATAGPVLDAIRAPTASDAPSSSSPDSGSASPRPRLTAEEVAAAKARGAYFSPRASLDARPTPIPASAHTAEEVGRMLLERLERGVSAEDAVGEVLGCRLPPPAAPLAVAVAIDSGVPGALICAATPPLPWPAPKQPAAPASPAPKQAAGPGWPAPALPPSRAPSARPGSPRRAPRTPSRATREDLASQGGRGEGGLGPVERRPSSRGLGRPRDDDCLRGAQEAMDFEKHLGQVHEVSQAAKRQLGLA